MRTPAIAVGLLLVLTACSEEIPEDRSARTEQPTVETTDVELSPEESGQALITAVESVLDGDPMLCGTGFDAVLPSVEDAAGDSYDQAAAEDLIREICAERDPLAPPAGETQAPATEYLTFGQTFTWEDGLAVTVTTPAAYTPSEGREVAGANAYLRLTITIKNGTSAEFDPALAIDRMQSGSTEAESIIDSPQGITGGPSITLLPGRDIVYDVAYGVEDPADLVFQFAPDWDHADAIYVSAP